jgi:hypothetical protein
MLRLEGEASGFMLPHSQFITCVAVKQMVIHEQTAKRAVPASETTNFSKHKLNCKQSAGEREIQ